LRQNVVILGGPNGAGKTTAARALLPERVHLHSFFNADEMAWRLSPEDVDKAAIRAGRIMIEQMREFVRLQTSFAFETTCAGKSYLKLMQECSNNGWRVSLIYLWVPSPEYSISRVARRVSQGGHGIPDETIHRRYHAGLWNMRHLYLPLAHDATIYDNRDNALRLIAHRTNRSPLQIFDEEIWTRIEEETQ